MQGTVVGLAAASLLAVACGSQSCFASIHELSMTKDTNKKQKNQKTKKEEA